MQQDETTPYSFFVDDIEISDTLGKTLSEAKTWTSSESVVQIVYQAQAVFRVRAVTRCTSSIEGHADAVLTLQFSSNGRCLWHSYHFFCQLSVSCSSALLSPGLLGLSYFEISRMYLQYPCVFYSTCIVLSWGQAAGYQPRPQAGG